jgi:hypothetical protein
MSGNGAAGAPGFPLKIGFSQLRRPKNQPKLDESVQLD